MPHRGMMLCLRTDRYGGPADPSEPRSHSVQRF